MTKKRLIEVIAWAAAFVAILLVASFFDLQINVRLGNADSVYGQFFRLFGELTGWIVVPVAGMFLYRVTGKRNKAAVVVSVFWALVTFVGWYLSLNYILEEFTGTAYMDGYYSSPYSHVTIYAAVFAVILTICSLTITKRIPKETLYKLAMLGAALLLALALSQIVANVLKIMWSRQRFRNLPIGNGGTDSTGFTPWYHPNFGKNKGANYFPDSAGMEESDAYKSFPSGHTAGAALTFTLLIIPDLFEKAKKFKPCFYVFAIVYTVAVAISRIVNRAHYLSDTLFGGYIGAMSSFAAIAIVKKLSVWGNKKFAKLIPPAPEAQEVVAYADDTEEPKED